MNMFLVCIRKMSSLLSLSQQTINRIYSFLLAEDIVKSYVVCKALREKVAQVRTINILWDQRRFISVKDLDTVVLPFIWYDRTIIVRFPKGDEYYDASVILGRLIMLINHFKRSGFSLYLIFDADAYVKAGLPHYEVDFENIYDNLVKKGSSIEVFIERIDCNINSLSNLQGYNTLHRVVHIESLLLRPDLSGTSVETCRKLRESVEGWPSVRKLIYYEIVATFCGLRLDDLEEFGEYVNVLDAEYEFVVNFDINLSDYRDIESLRNGVRTLKSAKEKKIKLFFKSVSIVPSFVKDAEPMERILMTDILSLVYNVCDKKTNIVIKDKVTYSISDKIAPEDIIKMALGELPIQDTENTIYI